MFLLVYLILTFCSYDTAIPIYWKHKWVSWKDLLLYANINTDDDVGNGDIKKSKLWSLWIVLLLNVIKKNQTNMDSMYLKIYYIKTKTIE